jgi:UDP-N-acetylglucosamine--N-acetylmuramyl-(pentapeptide) pyrophosphoryl-undecaprenol N-acetylglucosamine transferase
MAAVTALRLDTDKKTLLITGASSGSRDINDAILKILPQLERFAADWQIVHLTGQANFQNVAGKVKDCRISYIPVEYYDDMPNLYAAADLIVGRSGAVSVAEYAAAAKPCICIPYPYHKDNHQFLNAEQLTRHGAAVVAAQDLKNPARFVECLEKLLLELMSDDTRRAKMAQAAARCAKTNAARMIADIITQ